MARRRLTEWSFALLTIALLSAVAACSSEASVPVTIIDDPASGADVVTGAAATCTLQPGTISNVSVSYQQPDAFRSVAFRVPQCNLCPSPQTLDIKTVSLRVRWPGACTAQAEVSIVRGIDAGGGCFVPDTSQVLCGPIVHTISSTGSVGIIHTLPLPAGCCVTGDTFVLVRFTGFQSCAGAFSPFLTILTAGCTPCEAYYRTYVSAPTHTDWCAQPSTNGLWWQLEADCCSVTGVNHPLHHGAGLQLAVSPNPATSTAEVIFDMSSAADARLEIFDVSGRRCATLAAGWFEPGSHRAIWRGEIESGDAAPPGIYRARLTTPEGVVTKNVVWLPK